MTEIAGEERTALLEWNDLALILAICRAGSLSGAGRSLGQTHSTVFRRLNAIEERTGVRFFDRMRQGYVMTDAGRTAMAYGERVEGEFHALGLEVLGQDTALSGRIRVTSPEAFAEDLAPGIIARFVARHPEIQIDLSPGHGAVDLNRREAEVAIRATKAPPETSFGRKVADFRFALYASPQFLDRAGDAPLETLPVCLIEGSGNWLTPVLWPSRAEMDRRAVFQCRASRAVMNAAAEGLGFTFMPCYAADRDDRLVRISGTFPHLDMGLWVLTHPDLRGTARVRALMSHLYEELSVLGPLFAGELPLPGGRALLDAKK